MYSIFLKAYQKTPSLIGFILSNNEQLSYSQANTIVDLWASYFISIDVRQGDRVAILTSHEDLYPFLHLALDKINATTVPLDIEVPPAQLNTDIKKLDLKKLMLDEQLIKHFNIPVDIQTILQTTGISPGNFEELANFIIPDIIRNPEIPNYIMPSSGVTESKKWIPIGSEGLSYWGKTEKKLLQLKPGDKILSRCSPGYDAKLSEYIRSFAVSGTLVLMGHTERRSLTAVLECCQKEKISCLILIASQLNITDLEVLIDSFSQAGLMHLMVTGDACTLRLKTLCEKYNIKLWNCYGPTEATLGMSILCVNHLHLYDEKGEEIVPIGVPYGKQIKYHIIDGCLYIESPFLSSGYINNPELTAKNFPHLMINGRLTRVFNTENRFFLKDNFLVFQGRIDSKAHCKVSGVKVEPYAIQQCFEKYNDELGKEVLSVYVVIKT